MKLNLRTNCSVMCYDSNSINGLHCYQHNVLGIELFSPVQKTETPPLNIA
jgi:hypothetical protein